HGCIALEGRIPVGHDPHQPLAVRTAQLEGRSGAALGLSVLAVVSRTERAGQVRVALDRMTPLAEGVRAVQAVAGDDNPSSGQRIEPKLTHTLERTRAGRCMVRIWEGAY